MRGADGRLWRAMGAFCAVGEGKRKRKQWMGYWELANVPTRSTGGGNLNVLEPDAAVSSVGSCEPSLWKVVGTL